MSGIKRLLVPLFLIVLLSGCTSISKPGLESGGEIWRDRHLMLGQIQDWRLQARIGVVSTEESGSGNLYWQQTGESFLLKVTGPFGRGLVSVEGNERETILRNGSGEMLIADNPETLLWQQTGWRIPLQGLKCWILGMPSDQYADENYSLDASGRISRLQAGGWRVEYLQYERHGAYELPVKIRMQNGRIKIKLVILDWEVTHGNPKSN